MGLKVDGFIPYQAPSNRVFVWVIFQTKRHWKAVVYLETIRLSVEMLNIYARTYESMHFCVPYAAVDCGQIGNVILPSKFEINEILFILPDNVKLYSRSRIAFVISLP